MPVYKGSHIDGVKTLADLKGRCVIDQESGCWHLRTAHGKAWPRKQTFRVWSHTEQRMVSAPRLAWILGRRRDPLLNGERCYRTCTSYDCVCPQHLGKGSQADHAAAPLAMVAASLPARQAHARRIAMARSTVQAEMRVWLLESSQPTRDVAHGLGVKSYTVNNIRRYARQCAAIRPASVFDLGGIFRRAA